MPLPKVADLPPTAGVAAEPDKSATGIAGSHSDARPIEEQVAAATAVASQITAATAVPALERNAGQTSGSDQRETTAANGLVALVMVLPDITSVADLSGKTIAIDEPKSAAGRQLSVAIAAAGATGVQLTDGPTKAIDQLLGGMVPAALLGLVSAGAAEGFPEIAGFKVLQVPLSPAALKAGADTP